MFKKFKIAAGYFHQQFQFFGYNHASSFLIFAPLKTEKDTYAVRKWVSC